MATCLEGRIWESVKEKVCESGLDSHLGQVFECRDGDDSVRLSWSGTLAVSDKPRAVGGVITILNIQRV